MADSSQHSPAIKKDMDDDFPHVVKNQYVLIHMPSGNTKMINLHPDTKISLGKFGTFQSNNLIDQPYGLSYEIYDKDGHIRPVKNFSLEAVEETAANNQNITDAANIQALSHEQVEKLKTESHSGKLDSQQLIEHLMNSHSAFDKKTEYSKHKYIQRKKKKFLKVFTPVRPTLYSITDYFYSKNPDKINFLRVDTLSQLLSKANVRAHSKLLIVDDTQGLIVAAAAERMGGHGTIVAVHDGDNNNYDILRYLNFTKDVANTIHTLPLARINPDDPDEQWVDKSDEELKTMSQDNLRLFERKKKALLARNTSRKLLFEGNFDGLLVSSPYTTESIIQKFAPYLSGSRPIVAYSYAKESLLSAADYMRQSADFIESNVTESFLRRYQVLPGRTHPEMTMSASGGYLLSGIKVIDCEFDPNLVVRDESSRRTKKRKNDSPAQSDSNADTPTTSTPTS
ncbi:Gcd10p-domain-containing protein [Hesseltinella vesiculosa]|uniref:tRNA (adenine(58)-N(1))-methyltransferase non-catalytic subunit TRM6 n=1 Tax=Hesseltinella vesiculosa TaxID=101127 RepID=A0A1X2GGW9_9FUNG|nr:Gcd10p-domain-containing protein [Hesseltinella vesiculosa]